MSLLASQPSPDRDDLLLVAAELLGKPVDRLVATHGGGNNRMFKAEASDGAVYAFKVYGNREDDPRDRMGAEVGALRFLERYNVSVVPKVIAHDRQMGCALYEWIKGSAVHPPGTIDVDAALRFIAELHVLGEVDGTERLPLASAATLSADAVVTQISSRRSRFEVLSPDAEQYAEVLGFLDEDFTRISTKAIAAAHAIYAAANMDFDAELKQSQWVLSPSDFGFHNALRRKSGSLAFLDFEYFGWDDPAKLVSDFLLHPGMTLSKSFGQRFHIGALAVYGDADPSRRCTLCMACAGV